MSAHAPSSLARVARPLRVVTGTLWAAVLMLAGLWLLRARPTMLAAYTPMAAPLTSYLAMFAIATALLLFMVLVADALCPQAPIYLTISCKILAGAVALGALLATVVVLIWPSRQSM